MAEVKSVSAAKSKTAKPAAPKAKASKPSTTEDVFDMSMPEVPAIMQEMAEKSVAQAKDTYEKIRVAAEEATDLMEDSYESARQTTIGFNLKAIDTVKTNSDATFEFMKELLGAKSLAEAIELQSSFVREQFDVFSAQAKDMQDLATKALAEAGEPMKDMFDKAMKDMAQFKVA